MESPSSATPEPSHESKGGESYEKFRDLSIIITFLTILLLPGCSKESGVPDKKADKLKIALILAREISACPALLIASCPTRGVDIGAGEFIHEKLLAMRAEGAAIMLISEDLDEIIALSDRIAVINKGEIMGIVAPSAGLETIGMMMGGEQSGPCERTFEK